MAVISGPRLLTTGVAAAIDAGRSMRTVVQDAGDAGELDDFAPAIVSEIPGFPAGCVSRDPLWYVARYAHANYRCMIRVLDHIGLRWHQFSFEFQRPRDKPTTRSWFPGYIFLNFDVRMDRWQQVRRIPGIIELLGGAKPTPIDEDVMEDLMIRLTRRLPKSDEYTTIPPGRVVNIVAGVFKGSQAVVQSSNKREVSIVTMMFGRPAVVRVPLSGVRVVE